MGSWWVVLLFGGIYGLKVVIQELTSGWFFRAVVRDVSLSKPGKSGGLIF